MSRANAETGLPKYWEKCVVMIEKEWEFKDGTIDVPLADVLLKVIEDPRVIANFNIENIDHFTGLPIILTARMTEDGKPLLGLTEVYAELVSSPAVSTGTIMAENSPPPGYPPLTQAADRTQRSHYLLGVMESMGIETLCAIGGPKVYLHDDGNRGDLTANDGIYTGVFSDTRYEGSYTFKFRARGKNRIGITFDRTVTLSEYVKFAASHINTKVSVIETKIDNEKKIVIAKIKVTPRDSFGSYLGPFRGDVIQLLTTSGAFMNLSLFRLIYANVVFSGSFPLIQYPLV